MPELQENGRTAFLSLFDFLREFGSDYDRLVDFLTAHVAVNIKDEALKNASDWPSRLDSMRRAD
jgi:hypothetical protein